MLPWVIGPLNPSPFPGQPTFSHFFIPVPPNISLVLSSPGVFSLNHGGVFKAMNHAKSSLFWASLGSSSCASPCRRTTGPELKKKTYQRRFLVAGFDGWARGQSRSGKRPANESRAKERDRSVNCQRTVGKLVWCLRRRPKPCELAQLKRKHQCGGQGITGITGPHYSCPL